MTYFMIFSCVLCAWAILGIIAGERIRGLAEVRKLHVLAHQPVPPGPVHPQNHPENQASDSPTTLN